MGQDPHAVSGFGFRVSERWSIPAAPFLVMGSVTGSGMMPGAAVTLNPYVAAAKFILAKNASDKDVIHAASSIASEILR